MRRTRFLHASAAVGAATLTGQAASAQSSPSPALAIPAASAPPAPRRKASQIFTDPDINFVFLGVLGGTYFSAADIGSMFAVADEIEDGNAASAFAAFTSHGERMRAIGDKALAGGHRASAREAYLQSSSYTFAATYFCDRMKAPERMMPTWKNSRATLDAAFRLSERPIEHVRVPYQGTTLPGYFFKVDASGKKRPLLLLVNGSDGSVLDMWLTAAAGVERGYNCLTVDGPGQGAAFWLQGLPFRYDWEKVVTPMVNFSLKRSDVDPKRVAIQGISQGGYWVPRAVAFEHRIAAAIADPGVMDISTSWEAGLPPPFVALFHSGNRAAFDNALKGAMASPTFAFRARPFGALSPFDLFTEIEKYTLTGVTKNIRCPMLITSPEGEQFWPGQSQQLYDALPGRKTLVPFTVAEGGQYHCEPMANGMRTQRVFDWLDTTLSYRSP